MRAARYAFGAVFLIAAQRADAQDVAAPEQAPAVQVPTEAAPSEPAPAVKMPTEAAPAEPTLPDQEAESSARLSEAELASLGLGTDAEALDTDLHFSGFMDVNAAQLLNPHEAPLGTRGSGTEASFFVGHLNLYATKNITASFRMMAEIRFLYSPNGAQGLLASSAPISTQVSDYSTVGANMRWGGISIERAYGEWSPFPFLSLRLGAFLTPYGIWNVDHGSPVFIPVARPYAVNGGFFPEHQTGLEAFGRTGLTSNLAIRYHLTFSNGLGPVSEYRDLDANKGIGGRLALEYVGLGMLQVGGSAFYAQNSVGAPTIGLDANGTGLTLNKSRTDEAYVASVAADVLWKYRGFHVQAEWVGQRWDYTTNGRGRVATAGQLGIPADALAVDSFSWASYALVGYRLPWLGIMPFATIDYQRTALSGVLVKGTAGRFGLNVRPTDAIVAKLEYQFALSGTKGTKGNSLVAQLAWAF